MRIGRHDAVHEEVRGHCVSGSMLMNFRRLFLLYILLDWSFCNVVIVVYTAAMNLQGVEDLKGKLDQVKVVAVTCLGITSPLLANKRFDVCIMDEAGQTTLPVCNLKHCLTFTK